MSASKKGSKKAVTIPFAVTNSTTTTTFPLRHSPSATTTTTTPPNAATVATAPAAVPAGRRHAAIHSLMQQLQCVTIFGPLLLSVRAQLERASSRDDVNGIAKGLFRAAALNNQQFKNVTHDARNASLAQMTCQMMQMNDKRDSIVDAFDLFITFIEGSKAAREN